MGNTIHGWRVRVPRVAVVGFPSHSVHRRKSLTTSRLYIIEGIITVVWAGVCIFVVPKNYETAYFLNDGDKAVMKQRAELMEAYSGGSGHYGKKDIKEAASDIKSWVHGLIQIAVVTILYGLCARAMTDLLGC